MDQGGEERRQIVGMIKERAARLERPPLRVDPGNRIVLRETGDGLGVHNPTRRSVPLILFMLVWLAGWTAGEVFALSQIFDGSIGITDIFLLFWLTLWTIGGVFAWSTLLWNLLGVERLFITGGGIVRELGLGFMRFRKVYQVADVSDVRVSNVRNEGAQSMLTRGRILFDVAGRVRSFGIGLDTEETSAVFWAMRRHLPEGAVREP